MNSTLQNSLSQMNSFLRGEISAVETYRQCIERLSDSVHRSVLEEGGLSHQRRVDLLRDWIRRHGGTPAPGSGPWGGLVKLLEGGAAIISDKAAVAVLEEGEDHGRDEYQKHLADLDPDARKLVADKILPEQLATHDALSALKEVL